MNLLVLGGTRFVGRHIVQAARERGHTVTLFNRGKSDPNLFPDVETLIGDRNGDLSALQGRHWDAVIDTSGYVPRVVRASAELLAAAAEHYTFISTISVYADDIAPHADEDAPLRELDDPSVEEVTGETYGGLKVLCERAVREVFPEACIVRPGLVVGPHDPTDRFTYWPHRVAQGGEVLAPGGPDVPVQFIDARDLAAWTVACTEARRGGVYNAVTPADSLTFGELLTTCRQVSGSDARFTWVEEGFLREQGVTPDDLPLWLPEHSAFFRLSSERAVDAGLSFRPLEATVRDTLAWDRAREEAFKGGLSREREGELLSAWHARGR